MKVLFLDIDGVLNRNGTRERCGPYIGVDEALVKKFLAWRERHPDVEVVLSSAWRRYPPPKFEHWDYLRKAGIDWIDVTPDSKSGHRGMEINAWLTFTRPDVVRYAIIDDNSDMLPEQMPNFVQTNPGFGLRDKDLDRLDRILS